MADILTQLQTCLDQLATQFYATASYLSQRHPLVPPDPVPNDPYTLPPSSSLTPGPEDTDPNNPRRLIPDTPSEFASAQRELARDLVIKGAQIEYLIGVLPGIDTREQEQERRIRSLVRELEEMEAERKVKRKEMRGLVRRLENVVMGVAVSGQDVTMNGVHGHI